MKMKICHDQCCNDAISYFTYNTIFFTVFLTIKTLSQNISMTLLQISLKLHEQRGRFWKKKLPWTILEEQFLVPRYTAAVKKNRSFRCYDNSDAVATLIITNFHLLLVQLWWKFFQNFVYGDVVYAQTCGRYWPWKTVSNHLKEVSWG